MSGHAATAVGTGAGGTGDPSRTGVVLAGGADGDATNDAYMMRKRQH